MAGPVNRSGGKRLQSHGPADKDRNKVNQDDSKNAIQVTPYVMHRMRVSRSQTYLSLKDYRLMVVPYRLAKNRVTLLGALSSEEIHFFAGFKDQHVTLTLTCATSYATEQSAMLIRGDLTRVGELTNRKNVGVFELTVRSEASAYEEMFLNYERDGDRLKELFPGLKGRFMKLAAPGFRELLGLKPTVEVHGAGLEPCRLTLYAIAADRLIFEPPADKRPTVAGTLHAKLSYRHYDFAVRGIVDGIDPESRRFEVSIEYTRELVDVIATFLEAMRRHQRYRRPQK